MSSSISEKNSEERRDAIDAYLECTTYCSLDEQENDCRTICMERHLKANYFWSHFKDKEKQLISLKQLNFLFTNLLKYIK